MPKFVYKPEGVDEPREWDFEPNKLMSPECIEIEKLTGMTYGEWQQALGRQSMAAIHALLYVLMKRTSPQLRPHEVQFCMDDIDMTMSDDEARAALEKLEQIPEDEWDDEDRQIANALRVQLGDTPKVPAPSTSGSESAT